MPSPTASKKERILENVRTTLAAIVGDGQNTNYHFTPDRVLRVDGADEFLLDTTLSTLWYVKDARETYEPLNSEFWDAELEVLVVGMRKHLSDSDDPMTATTEPRSTVRSRLLRDAQKALLADVTRGGLADNTDLVDVNGALLEMRPWADVELLLRIEYSFAANDPSA